MFSLRGKKQSNCKNQQSSSRQCNEYKFNSQLDNQLSFNFGDTDQYNLTENRVYRAIRGVKQFDPYIEFDDLLANPDIALLLGVLDVKDIKGAYGLQPKVFNEHVAIEYLNRTHWNLNEAVYLTAGLDPFYAAIDPTAYIKVTHEKLANIEFEIRCAMKSRVLNAFIHCGALAIEVATYCKWAVETGIENEDMLNYFRKVLGAQTLLTSGGRANATSSPSS